MTKISTFVPDTEINGKDKLIGTDFNNAQKTKNFKVEDLGTHFNLVNGSRNFEYLFYNHLSISQAPADGAFYANGNEQDPNNITHFFISKKTINNKDVSSFFDSITDINPFDLIISQSTDLNTIFFFNITDVEAINGYYKLTVSEVFFPQGKTLEFMASNMVFNLKANSESIHNNLSGLNDGDYKHLTALEKEKFDNLPNTFVTNHSQLSLNDGTNPHGTTKNDVGLGNADNTSDLEKPISNSTQTALNGKANTIHSHVISDVTGLQTALNLKLDKVSTVDVEKVYIKNADGTQGMKPVSEFGGGTTPISVLGKKSLPSSTLTGTTAETILETIVIPANTLVSGDLLLFRNRVLKSTTTAGFEFRYRISNTNSLSGAFQIAYASLPGSAFRSQGMERTINVRVNSIEVIGPNNSIAYENATTIEPNQSFSLDFSQPIYLFITAKLTSASDTIVNSNYSLLKL